MRSGKYVIRERESPVYCETPMERSCTKHTYGEGWADRYFCRFCGSEKWIKVGDPKK